MSGATWRAMTFRKAVKAFTEVVARAAQENEGYLPPEADYVPEGLRAALAVLSDPKCSTCGGTKRVHVTDLDGHVVCQTCKGTGLNPDRLWTMEQVEAEREKVRAVVVAELTGALRDQPMSDEDFDIPPAP